MFSTKTLRMTAHQVENSFASRRYPRGMKVFVLCLLLLSACHSPPRTRASRAAASTCSLAQTAERQNLKVFSTAVIKAIGEKDKAKLESFMACEIAVGPPRSEVEGVSRRDRALKGLLGRLQGYRWQEEGVRAETRYFVGSLPPSPYVELVFEHIASEGWLWVGISTADHKLRTQILTSL